ncbi:MAG: hypothetical protein CMJ45_02850, partial [Planctomyces sp.]|nr:hypothetical protein [Planctomyces sp.]
MNSGAVVQTNAFSQAPPGQASSRADQARYYTMQGLCLVKIPPGQKKPLTTGWQRNPIRKPTDAARHWSDHPNDNMGVLLGASGLVSLDVDDLDEARACLGRVGIDLDRLLADPAIPKIQGNPKKVRLLFQAPAGDKLTRKALRNDDVSVFELRGGSCQDVLPPSVHPETKQPYRWVPNPWEAGGIPVLPAQLLTLWRGWDELRPEMATEQIQAALREYQRRSPASSDAEWDAVRTEIRGRLSVDKKLREMGVRQTGQKFSCPFHLPDKNPSFWVHEDIWVCAHSGAPVGYEAPSGYSVGDVIDLHQYQLGFDSPGKAAADLARKLGVATPEQTEKTAERCSDTYSNTETSERSIELQPETAAQLIEDAPEVDYLVEHILPSGGASLVAGESGIGKTWVTLDLAISVALGRPWLAHFPAKQGNVLVIDEENAKPLLRKRLQKLLKAAQLDVDGSTLGVRFLTGKGINLSDPVFVSAVERVLAASSPDLVIIDSLVRIHTGNENDAGDMAKLF